MKLLYEIFETNNHWFFIYHKYYIEQFVIIKSIYNSCLFHCIKLFVVIDFQIDDILIFVNDDFAIKKTKSSKQLTSCLNSANVSSLLIWSNLMTWKFNSAKTKQSA